MRLFLTLLIFTVIFVSCSSCETKVINKIDNKDTFNLYIDTLYQIESSSLSSDSFKFSQYYDTKNSFNLIYHEVGKINNEGKQYGLSVFSVNDSTIRVKLLKKGLSKWIFCDSINIYDISFSPAMFYPVYSDFNQNGVNDILLVFYQSMSLAYSHGFLVLFSKETEKLNLVENSIDIPNLKVVNNKIISITHNQPEHELKEYIKTDKYKISNNRLILLNSN